MQQFTGRDDVSFGHPGDDELDELGDLLGAALHFPPDGMREWMEMLGTGNFRAARLRGRIAGGLGYVRMGQWFGGRNVPLAGVTAVGIRPEHRGTGIGSAMLRAALAELHAEGTPLAALYPATLPFYQRAGYERAGQRITYELPLDAIGVDEEGLELVAIPTGHYDEIYWAYEQRARRASGNLARPEWMWRNKLEPKERKAFRYLVTRDGQTEGYVVFTQGGRSDPLTILDACALTPAAGRRLLAFFAGYRSMVETLTWNGGPFDPFVYLLKEPLVAANRTRVKVVRSLDWMLRIVDVAGALTARGYAPGLQAELHLEVRDDVLPPNNGRFVVAVADGDARVRPGGAGRIRLGVRELAAIYTGFMAPAELSGLGAIDAPDPDLALMGALFAGPRPWTADMF